MSLAITLRSELGPPRLDQLAASIREQHEIVQESAQRALLAALACGEALVEAREMVPPGMWRAWLRENTALHFNTAQVYQRIARFRAELELAGIDSVKAAKHYLSTYSLYLDPAGSPPLPYEIVDEIRALRASGFSHAKIAIRVGASKAVVGRILRGDSHRKQPRVRRPGRRAPAPEGQYIPITDEMIEGMAKWLALRASVPLTDKTRAQATEALRVALNYKTQGRSA